MNCPGSLCILYSLLSTNEHTSSIQSYSKSVITYLFDSFMILKFEKCNFVEQTDLTYYEFRKNIIGKINKKNSLACFAHQAVDTKNRPEFFRMKKIKNNKN